MTNVAGTAVPGPRPSAVERALVHPVRTVVLVHLLSRAMAWLALEVAARGFQNPAGVGTLHPTAVDLLPLWDSQWYARIVTEGYPVPPPVEPGTDRLTYSAWAFYPLFPVLLRGLTRLGIPLVPGALALNVLLGTLAAVLIWAVLVGAGDGAPADSLRARLALAAACLWSFHPASAVLLKPYTEALAMVLVAGSLWALTRRRYLLVAALALLLGFTRGVAPALALVVLVHLVIRWRTERGEGAPFVRGQRWAAAAMLAAIGLSAVAWPGVAGWVTGIPSAFFQVQAAWGMQPGEGPFLPWLRWAWSSHGLLGVGVLLALLAAYAALVLGRHGSWLSAEVRAWALAYPVYLFAVVRPITSMWRFLLLDFPMAALLASIVLRGSRGGGLTPRWRSRAALTLVLLVLAMVAWTAALLTYTPWGSRPP